MRAITLTLTGSSDSVPGPLLAPKTQHARIHSWVVDMPQGIIIIAHNMHVQRLLVLKLAREGFQPSHSGKRVRGRDMVQVVVAVGGPLLVHQRLRVPAGCVVPGDALQAVGDSEGVAGIRVGGGVERRIRLGADVPRVVVGVHLDEPAARATGELLVGEGGLPTGLQLDRVVDDVEGLERRQAAQEQSVDVGDHDARSMARETLRLPIRVLHDVERPCPCGDLLQPVVAGGELVAAGFAGEGAGFTRWQYRVPSAIPQVQLKHKHARWGLRVGYVKSPSQTLTTPSAISAAVHVKVVSQPGACGRHPHTTGAVDGVPGHLALEVNGDPLHAVEAEEGQGAEDVPAAVVVVYTLRREPRVLNPPGRRVDVTPVALHRSERQRTGVQLARALQAEDITVGPKIDGHLCGVLRRRDIAAALLGLQLEDFCPDSADAGSLADAQSLPGLQCWI